MAAVRTSAQRIRDRMAIAAVILITIIMLAPIYWIASTAFKPRSLATTVPPTVFFTPEITPFIKLFTKRVQLLRPVDKQTYDAAPWWERARLRRRGARAESEATSRSFRLTRIDFSTV